MGQILERFHLIMDIFQLKKKKSGQGWDETNRNTSESKAEGRLFASLES